jgi:6,7-dimethyl-8-ribityllumazine synthase
MAQRSERSHPVDGAGFRIGLAVSRFNGALTAKMLAAAKDALLAAGVARAAIIVARVPGALELPFAMALLARRKKIHAAAAIGCVIRGDTYHFQVVADTCARGIMQAQLQTGTPMTNGVLTVEDESQARARINKGAEAALAAVEMAALKRRFDA